MTTLEQGLQRLAVLDGEWCKVEDSIFLSKPYKRFAIYEGGEVSVSIPLGKSDLDKFDERNLFGAVCARVEARGWKWLFYYDKDGMDEWQYFAEIREYVNENTSRLLGSCEESRSAAHAAVLAYVAALEGMRENRCMACLGTGEEHYYGYGVFKCNSCNGTGEKLEGPLDDTWETCNECGFSLSHHPTCSKYTPDKTIDEDCPECEDGWIYDYKPEMPNDPRPHVGIRCKVCNGTGKKQEAPA